MSRSIPDTILDLLNTWEADANRYDALGRNEAAGTLRNCRTELLHACAALLKDEAFPGRDALLIRLGSELATAELEETMAGTPEVTAAGAAKVRLIQALLTLLETEPQTVDDIARVAADLLRPSDVAKAKNIVSAYRHARRH